MFEIWIPLRKEKRRNPFGVVWALKIWNFLGKKLYDHGMTKPNYMKWSDSKHLMDF